MAGVVAGKKGNKTQRVFGSCASSGYWSYNYKGLLQNWVGITQSCDCDMHTVFADLGIGSQKSSYKPLGLGFGSKEDKEAAIRGIPALCGERHTFGRPLPGLNIPAVALKGAEELFSAGYGNFAIKPIQPLQRGRLNDGSQSQG